MSTTARITLTVQTEAEPVAGFPSVLGSAAQKGFKVDGWGVVDTEVEDITEQTGA